MMSDDNYLASCFPISHHTFYLDDDDFISSQLWCGQECLVAKNLKGNERLRGHERGTKGKEKVSTKIPF